MDIHTLFTHLTRLPAPHGLTGRIIARIAREEQRLARRLLVVSITALVLSLAGMVWALSAGYTAIMNTGLMHYISLLISDPSIVVSLWYQFTLTLIEALPLVALTVFVGATVVFLLALFGAAESMRRAFGTLRYA